METETEKQTKVYAVLVIQQVSYTCWVEATSKEEAEQAVSDIEHHCPQTVDLEQTEVEETDVLPGHSSIDITYAQIVAAAQLQYDVDDFHDKWMAQK